MDNNEKVFFSVGDGLSDKRDVILAQELEKNIVSDDILSKFVDVIEESLSKFVKIKNLVIYSNLNLEKDFEIPDFHKIVLSVKIAKLAIHEKLEIWDQLDDFIRTEIEKKCASYKE